MRKNERMKNEENFSSFNSSFDEKVRKLVGKFFGKWCIVVLALKDVGNSGISIQNLYRMINLPLYAKLRQAPFNPNYNLLAKEGVSIQLVYSVLKDLKKYELIEFQKTGRNVMVRWTEKGKKFVVCFLELLKFFEVRKDEGEGVEEKKIEG